MEVIMNYKKVMIFATVLVWIGFAAAENLLVNGDFEATTADLDAWNAWSQWWGGNSNKHVADPIEDDYCAGVWWHDDGILQTVDIGPGMYEFGGKIMTSEEGGMYNRRGLIQAEIGGLELQLDIVPGDAENVWFVKSGIIDNTTLGATSITINLLMDSFDVDPAGIVLYDDIYLGPEGISREAKFPVPANGATTVQPVLDVLSWQNPDPNNPSDIITSDVFLYAGDDPNLLKDPNVLPWLYADDITDEFVAVTLTPEQQYFWRVDCTDPHGDPNGPVTTQGEVWGFTTINDNPPVVDAGDPQYLWIDMDDGNLDPNQVTFQLDGQVTDDAQSPLTILWTLDYSEQDPATIVDIVDPNKLDTEVMIDGTGLFTFLLGVDDKYAHVEDTVTVIVYGTACEAAQGDPDDHYQTYEFIGDTNNDCEIDMVDLANLAATWLDCLSDKLGCTP